MTTRSVQSKARVANPLFEAESATGDAVSDDSLGSDRTGDEILETESKKSAKILSRTKSGDEYRADYFKKMGAFWDMMKWLASIIVAVLIAFLAYYVRPLASLETEVANLKEQNKEIRTQLDNIRDINTKNSAQIEAIGSSLKK